MHRPIKGELLGDCAWPTRAAARQARPASQ